MSIETELTHNAADVLPSTPGTPAAALAGDAGHRNPLTAGAAPMTPTGAPGATALPAEFLMGVRLTVSVEVGRIQMPIRQVMELGPGSVIELQRSAAEPVEIHANGRCIGYGEIVVVGDQFGVRITDLGGNS